MKRVATSRLRRRAALAVLAMGASLGFAPASWGAGGSFASGGTGTYAASLWWLDFAGFSSAAGSQGFSFTLPNGAGTLSTTVISSGNGTMSAVAEPPWSGGGAFGHGAYNGLTGSPVLYWLNQPGSPGTVTLSALTMRDAGGNARSFALYAADGENTNSPETIVFTSTAAWKLVDTVNTFAGYNGGVPTTSGIGGTTVTESAPAAGDSNYNASVVLGTANPSQVSAALANNEAVLFAVALPTVSLTVTVSSRVTASDEFTATVAYTSPAYSLKSASTTGAGTTASSGTATVIGGNGITLGAAMASGSASALSFYNGALACTNGGPGATSFTGASTVLPSGAGTSFTVTPQSGDAIACTLTLTPATQTLIGTVYADVNHDASLDNGEAGTGVSGLYVKLAASSGGVCQNPATAAAAVSSTTGAYSVPSVAPGTYCLTLTNSSALSNTTAYVPPGSVATEGAGARGVTVTGSPATAQNFGLYSGSQLNVVVFNDVGGGGGTANDGIENGSEAGVSGVAVTASVGGTALATATSSGSGASVLWLPSSAVGSVVTVTPTAPGGSLATGGSAGTTGGSYSRPTVSFTMAAGATYSGVAFGLVPASSLAPTGLQSAQPGTTIYYPHAFTAGSAGQVTFSASDVATPATSGWTEVLYADTACSGVFAAGDAALTGAVAVTAGQRVCLLVKEFVPANAPLNADDKITLSASMAYSGSAAPAASVLTVTDTTTVTTAGAPQLTKQVQNLTLGGVYGTSNTALPGNTLQYQLTVANVGSAALAAVVVDDATPAFTTFVAAACPASLPTGLTACSVSTKPAAGASGALQWTFTGTLAPGAQTAVTYQVVVAQ